MGLCVVYCIVYNLCITRHALGKAANPKAGICRSTFYYYLISEIGTQGSNENSIYGNSKERVENANAFAERGLRIDMTKP